MVKGIAPSSKNKKAMRFEPYCGVFGTEKNCNVFKSKTFKDGVCN